MGGAGFAGCMGREASNANGSGGAARGGGGPTVWSVVRGPHTANGSTGAADAPPIPKNGSTGGCARGTAAIAGGCIRGAGGEEPRSSRDIAGGNTAVGAAAITGTRWGAATGNDSGNVAKPPGTAGRGLEAGLLGSIGGAGCV